MAATFHTQRGTPRYFSRQRRQEKTPPHISIDISLRTKASAISEP